MSPAEIVEYGRKWREEKLAQGWEWTPDGYQSKVSILQAGYIRNSDGHLCIPAEEYIADGADDSRPAGQKYWGVSKKYLQWRRSRNREEIIGKDLKKVNNEFKFNI